jgi:hypothetical protein
MHPEEKEFLDNRNLVFIELGKFNVNFEQITHSFETIIEYILMNNGLNNSEYVDCLTGKLTAEPIKLIFQSMISVYIENVPDKKKVNNLLSIFSDLIEIRNIVIHCFWVIGVTEKEVIEPFVTGIKKRISKDGVGIYNLNIDFKELVDLNTKIVKFNESMFEFSKLFEKKSIPPSELDLSFLEDLNFRTELNKMKKKLG